MGGSTSGGPASCTVCGAAASMSSKTSPPRPNRFHCTMGAADPDLSWTSRSPRGVHANRPYPSRGSSEEIRCIPSVLQAASNCERERTLASFASRHFLDGPRLGPPRVSSGSLPPGGEVTLPQPDLVEPVRGVSFLGNKGPSSAPGHHPATNPLTKKGHNSRATGSKRRGSNWAASRCENCQKPRKMTLDRLFWRRFAPIGPPQSRISSFVWPPTI